MMKYKNEVGEGELNDERMIGGLALGNALEALDKIRKIVRNEMYPAAEIDAVLKEFSANNDTDSARKHADNTKRILDEDWVIKKCSHCGTPVWKYAAAVKGAKNCFCDKKCLTDFKAATK